MISARKKRRPALWMMEDYTRRLAKHLFMLIVAFVMLSPLLWMLASSLKEPAQLFEFPPTWIPKPAVFSNFVDSWAAAPFGRFFLNTFKVAGSVTFGTVFFSSLAAYAFARLKFAGRTIVFSMLLATLMIPYGVRVIPLYIMLRSFGWIDTHTALIVPPILSNVFGVFLLRQFFMSMPIELDEAALIDGCGFFGIYRRILLPLSKPALATLGLFAFRRSWNQFLPALIYINTTLKQVITVGLTIFQGELETEWHLLMAGSVIAVLPVLLIYALAQKYFVRGIVLSGIKG